MLLLCSHITLGSCCCISPWSELWCICCCCCGSCCCCCCCCGCFHSDAARAVCDCCLSKMPHSLSRFRLCVVGYTRRKQYSRIIELMCDVGCCLNVPGFSKNTPLSLCITAHTTQDDDCMRVPIQAPQAAHVRFKDAQVQGASMFSDDDGVSHIRIIKRHQYSSKLLRRVPFPFQVLPQSRSARRECQ